MFEPDTKGNNKLLEALAALEHEQWRDWTKYMLDNFSDENIERWKKQFQKPYDELDDKDKEKDRVWARKVLAIASVVAQQKFDKWAANLEKRLKRRKT